MIAGSSTASRRTCSPLRARAMSNGSRVTFRTMRPIKRAASAWMPACRIGSSTRSSRASAARQEGVLRFVAALLMLIVASAPATAADPAFTRWIATLWPAAQQSGVSRATFDAATRGLEPDLSLPDLVIPGRPDRQPAQAEFVQTPAEYLKESAFDRLAGEGGALAGEHRATLSNIEERFGVPGAVVLAIWGRETNYGAAKLLHSAIRALATQAYLGRRKEQFREEFLLALRMLQED